MQGYAFVDGDEEDGGDETEEHNLAEDEDEESVSELDNGVSEEQDVVSEPEPEPEPKKKGGRKKKASN